MDFWFDDAIAKTQRNNQIDRKANPKKKFFHKMKIVMKKFINEIEFRKTLATVFIIYCIYCIY